MLKYKFARRTFWLYNIVLVFSLSHMELPQTFSQENRLAKSFSIVALTALGAVSVGGCSSPEKEYCYPGKIDNAGVRADLLDEIGRNFDIDGSKINLKNLHGATVTSIVINAKLAGMHARAHSRGVPLGQVIPGDRYTYCLSSSGLITPGKRGYKIADER
jgi:hypothetical protein